jgi:hypothetical protein
LEHFNKIHSFLDAYVGHFKTRGRSVVGHYTACFSALLVRQFIRGGSSSISDGCAAKQKEKGKAESSKADTVRSFG